MTKSRIIALSIIVVILAWTVFSFPSKIETLRAASSSIICLPLEVLAKSFNYFSRLSHLSYTNKRIIELEDRIRSLKKELINLEEAKLENDRLRNLLEFKKKTPGKSIPALVIGRDPNNWSSVVFIDKGSGDGINKNMIVISGSGLVGRIREVGKARSKVMLINDVDSKLGALVHQTRDQGLLIGSIDGKCKLIYLPLETDIKIGYEVLTSGMGSMSPKGISLGEIKSVEKERGKLYKYAIVEPASQLSKLEEVMCIE